ncbi:type 4 prepilin peptidase 1 . Aspartic peptidase. MEROPS family A24A [Desulfatibacillum alkenivorans DSM 16219]|jgi:leader peptidase (prepilin peptidase)/N-methyltransferase|uniref:Prepilin leader peptidase/N-methyltransferase n=1 Tax=Desulfatibacillum alkenivorans DSM 16219 TaxID=1121393 RepID=A0A1M7AMJ6_9BACT|nr:A24 family peptidase [Desulfatibacillum alkenivorans]SHL43746.1 type 4 prepilin peptidase 1 . Aspartic peptidase. MEROPS family A24A [Desulfatibacillum alkenivorans DSM 16219]
MSTALVPVLPYIFVLAFGLILGSFLNVCIFRIPEGGVPFSEPRSHCPRCNAQIAWYDNIPVASYIVLTGKCRACKAPISIRYPLVELASGMFALACAVNFGFTWAALVYYLLIATLLVITFIDLDHMIIPNVITLPGIPIGIAASFLLPELSLTQSLIGVAVGGGGLFAISELFYLLRKKEGMGMGDVKLLGMLGAFLGLKGVLFTIMAGAFVGTIMGVILIPLNRSKGLDLRIPFGPFLASGAIVYIFWGEFLIYKYLEYARGGF